VSREEPSLALAYGCSRTRINIGSDIVDFKGDEIAAPQFAIDGEIEQREISDIPVQPSPVVPSSYLPTQSGIEKIIPIPA
jgi:hypothetical protein